MRILGVLGSPRKNGNTHILVTRILEGAEEVGTPVYWYGPTAFMKAFIDRFVYFNCPENREKIRGKSAVIAIPYEEDNPETVAPLEMLFEKSFQYLEMKLAGKIVVPGVGAKGDVLKKKDRLHIYSY